jgi:hypothetical protein
VGLGLQVQVVGAKGAAVPKQEVSVFCRQLVSHEAEALMLGGAAAAG